MKCPNCGNELEKADWNTSEMTEAEEIEYQIGNQFEVYCPNCEYSEVVCK